VTSTVRAQLGRTVFLRFTARKVRDDAADGQRQRVNGCRITITGPTGASVVANGVATYERKGTYLYAWNTAGLAAGDYRATALLGVGFDSVTSAAQNKLQRSLIVRLVDTL
jgi:hypothetical protein